MMVDTIVLTIAVSCLFLNQVAAFDNTRYDNVSPILSSSGSLLSDNCIGGSVRFILGSLLDLPLNIIHKLLGPEFVWCSERW